MRQTLKLEMASPTVAAGAGSRINGSIAWLRVQVPLLLRRTPFDTSTEVGRSKERYRRIALTTATSVANRGLGILAALVSVPLTLTYLGKERYGLWMTISSIVAMLTFADFGMGNGLLNALAAADGENDRLSIQKFVSSAFYLLSGTALVIAILFGAAYPWVRWAGLFNVNSLLAQAESAPAVAAFAACFIVNLPLGIVPRIQNGHQEGYVSNIWQALGSVLSIIGVLLAVHLKWGLPRLILAVSGGPVIATIANGVSIARLRPWLLPRWHYFRWTTTRILAGSGFLFFLLQVGYVMSFSADNLIAARIAGASAVPQYAVAQRVFLMVALLQSTWLAPLWPAYGEAIQRGDIAWVRRTLKRSVVIVVLVTALFSGLLVAISRPLFKLWVGPDLVPSWTLTIGLAVSGIVQAAGNAVAMYLNASNALVFELSLAFAFIVFATTLKILLCHQIGVAGIAWGAVIAYILVFTVPYVLAIPRLLGRHRPA
jgi:O-antigen/teichoic acid export membrane protein